MFLSMSHLYIPWLMEGGVEYLSLENITPDNLKTERNGHVYSSHQTSGGNKVFFCFAGLLPPIRG
jgi:hypothetical protein